MSKLIGYITFFLILINPLVTLSQECNNAALATTTHLQDNGDGTVSDIKTGLVWKKCSEGQSWNSGENSCDGNTNTYNWKASLQRARAVNKGSEGENLGKIDWRIPNIKELSSIVERKCIDPSINATIFPFTASTLTYVSSTLSNIDGGRGYGRVWLIRFFNGYNIVADKSNVYHVRLTR